MADEAAVIEPKPDAAVAPPPDAKKPAETTKISLDPGAKPIDVLGQIGELGKGAERAGEQVKALDLEAMKLNMPQLQTAPKPTPKLTKPEDMWASAAMIFAALGSVLSRRHASTALNAAATVLDTFKKNDKEATDLAFSTWKAENENYMKVANCKMQAYNAAMGQIDKRKAEAIRAGSAQDKTAEAKLKALSHAFEDPAMLRELERGGLAAAMELQQTREKQKLALDKNSRDLEQKYEIHQRKQAMLQSDEYKAAVAAKDQYTLARLWSETGDPDGMKAFQKVMAKESEVAAKLKLEEEKVKGRSGIVEQQVEGRLKVEQQKAEAAQDKQREQLAAKSELARENAIAKAQLEYDKLEARERSEDKKSAARGEIERMKLEAKERLESAKREAMIKREQEKVRIAQEKLDEKRENDRERVRLKEEELKLKAQNKTKAQYDAERQQRLEELYQTEDYKSASPQDQLTMRASLGDPSAMRARDRAKREADYKAEYAQREMELTRSEEFQNADVDQKRLMLAQIGSKRATEVIANVAPQGSRSGANISITPTLDNPYGLTEAERQQARAIAAYKQAMPSSSRDIRSRLIRSEVERVNPDWQEGLSRARLAGWSDWISPQKKGGQTVISLNTVSQHLNAIEEMMKNLDNSDFPAVNAIKNKVSDFLGYPEVRSFEAGRQIVAGEIIKMLTGLGTRADREEAERAFSKDGSPAQQQKVLNLTKDLIAGRLLANVGAFKQQTGASVDDFANLLTDETRSMFQNYLTGKTGSTGATSGITPEAPRAVEAPKAEATFPAEYLPRLQEAAKNGKGIRLEDGTVWGFVNGKPVQQMRK